MGMHYPARFGESPLLARIDEKGITAFEATLGTVLPDDYRQFLCEWNGVDFTRTDLDPNTEVVFAAQEIEGHTSGALRRDQWPERCWEWNSTVWEVSWLNGIGPYDCLKTLSKDKPGYGFEVWAPPRFLAIGFSIGETGHICISLADADRGEVYIWRWPEDPPLDGEVLPNMRCMWWVAPSFREFWDVLIPIGVDELLDKWT